MAFSFSLKEEKKKERPKGKKNPNSSEHFGTKKWYLGDNILLVKCLGSKESCKKSPQCARISVPLPPPPSVLCPRSPLAGQG